MWKHRNEVIYNSSRNTASISSINDNNNIPTINKISIANILNDYFMNVGRVLHDNIPHTHTQTHNIDNNPRTIRLFHTTEEEITTKIRAMKKKHNIDDFISSNSCKDNCNLLAPILCRLINECLTNGTFPSILKCSRIVPIYKEGSPLHPVNYRPIINACCIFIDLRKPFHTIPHTYLLNKIFHYGIRGIAHTLLSDYLSLRKQYVDIKGIHSDNVNNQNQFGLPQGSNLGPLLFLLYINGIFDLKLNGTLLLYADDATLVYFHTDPHTLEKKLQEDLNLIANWLRINKLTLNATKTKYMIIKACAATNHSNDLNLRIDNNILSRVTSFKYMGITLQENLKWNLHIDSICRKIMGITSIVNRLGNKIHQSTRISFYYSMINSHLSYLLPVWCTSASQNDLSRL